MAMHSYHPDISEHGLADDCPRCAELAEHPFEGLDTRNLCLLAARTFAWMEDAPEVVPRSENEHIAMRRMENHMRKQRILELSRANLGLVTGDVR